MVAFVATPVLGGARVAPAAACGARTSTFVASKVVPAAAPSAGSATLRMAATKRANVPLNLFRPKTPYEATVLYNARIVGKDAPGETVHLIFQHDGNVPYLEGQSIGVMAPGLDAKGKPHKVRLYSIASTRYGDFGDGKTVSLSVKRLLYNDDEGKEVKGVCSNFLCDLAPGDKVSITGPVGTAMLMPEDPNATVIMLATGTGIAPFRTYMRRAFTEKHSDYKFTGKMWLFLGYVGGFLFEWCDGMATWLECAEVSLLGHVACVPPRSGTQSLTSRTPGLCMTIWIVVSTICLPLLPSITVCRRRPPFSTKPSLRR